MFGEIEIIIRVFDVWGPVLREIEDLLAFELELLDVERS